MDGAIIYINITKGQVIYVGQLLGVLKWQKYEQQGLILDTSDRLTFPI